MALFPGQAKARPSISPETLGDVVAMFILSPIITPRSPLSPCMDSWVTSGCTEQVQVSRKRLHSVNSGAASSLIWAVAAAPGQGRAGANAAPCWSILSGGLGHCGNLPSSTEHLFCRN